MIDGHYRMTVSVDQVDAWYLDRLTEREDVFLSAGDVERIAPLLDVGEIYAGVERSLTIEASAREIEQAQRDLISAAAKGQVVFARPILRSLYRRVLTVPYEESLCHDVALLHAVGGFPELAQDLISLTRREISQMYGQDVSDELLVLERRIAHTFKSADGRVDDADARTDPSRPTVLPPALQTQGEVTVRARAAAELAAQLAPDDAVVVLSAPAGSASLRLISHALEVADWAPGVVLFARCSEGITQSYEPFLEMLPGLRRAVARNIDQQSIPDPTVLWAAVTEELSELAGGDAVTLVISGAHDVDSASIDLITFLARSSLTFSFRLLLAARSDVDRPEYTRLLRLLKEYESVTTAEIEPLTVDQVVELVGMKFPHASLAVRRSISEELFTRSGGLYQIVTTIIDQLDPTTLRLPDSGTGQSIDVFSQLVERLSRDARSVGVAAAVLGRVVSLNDLQQMCDLGPDDLLDVVEELLDAGLMVETAGVDRLSFAHQLAMDEFINQTRKIRLRQMHMKARNLTDDPHRRARHDLLAHPTVPTAEVRSSQLRSARLLHSQGSYREAATAFRNALSIEPDQPLSTGDAIAHADVVSRTGALREAAELRSDVIRRCVSSGDWDGVLDAATVGLPHAELIDGDPERFAQLSSIPPERLTPAKRFEHALHLTRQASLLGREEVSRTWVERAEIMAETPEQKAAVAFAWRMANDVTAHPAERLRRINAALALGPSDEDRLLLLQVAALDQYELGYVDEAIVLNEEFAQLAEQLANPIRSWHSRLFRSMHHFTTGNWDEASAQADNALEHGQRFGITIAGPTRLAQEFFPFWLAGTHAELVPILDAVPPDDASSLLFQSAHVASLFAAGQQQRAVSMAVNVARRFLAAPAAHGLASVAVMAPVLAASGDGDLVDKVELALSPHTGSALLVGAGVGNLGPIDRYIAQLRGGPDETAARRFIEQADALHMPLWRLMTRLELIEITGDRSLMAESVHIAAGTSLERFLPD
ncbi:MAG: hypothetical protein HKN24_00445 [Acidimicrobiales bacterium]|nr:hypothetical protein [Acidimicrobiales bacterium]